MSWMTKCLRPSVTFDVTLEVRNLATGLGGTCAAVGGGSEDGEDRFPSFLPDVLIASKELVDLPGRDEVPRLR